MASLNKVFLMGNLTRDPELRYTPSGTAVSDMRLAVDDSYSGRDGNKVERTLFIDVVAWQRQAETVSEYLSKGSPIFVEGRLQLDEWESKEGEKRSRIRVVAQRVQFLGSPRDSGGGGRDDQSSRPPRAERPSRPSGQGSGPPDEVPGPDDVSEDDIPF